MKDIFHKIEILAVVAGVLLSGAFLASLNLNVANAQGNESATMGGNMTGGNATMGGNMTGGNASTGAVGSASQLMALLGNNAELIANGTSIGNPNASTAEKMATNESNAGGNQTGNQSGSPQQGSAGNQ